MEEETRAKTGFTCLTITGASASKPQKRLLSFNVVAVDCAAKCLSLR